MGTQGIKTVLRNNNFNYMTTFLIIVGIIFIGSILNEFEKQADKINRIQEALDDMENTNTPEHDDITFPPV